MIVGILGDLGAGKTLNLTRIGIMDWLKGRKIYANYKLNIKDCVFLENPEDLNQIEPNSTLMLDEIHFWLDSRKFGTAKNYNLANFLLDSRRKHFNIYFTAQWLELVDIRLRKITNIIITPQLYKSFKLSNGEIGYHNCFAKCYDRNGKYLKSYKFKTKLYHSLYDSYQNMDYLKGEYEEIQE